MDGHSDDGPRQVPIGTGVTGVRTERDALGAIEVPAEHYWGAQTQRSLDHFRIGDERMPIAVVHAYGLIKEAAAQLHSEAGRIDPASARAIETAAGEVSRGDLDDEFPLSVWQTGSGTQTNMNVNEVIANRANQLLGTELGGKAPVHPNDHVNLGQSTNDTFVTAMHIATLLEIRGRTLPRIDALADAIWEKAVEWVDVVKIGRTHLQDATPLTVGQAWSGWATQLRDARAGLEGSIGGLYELAVGGTAVGTGVNAPEGFGAAMAERLSHLTGLPLVPAPNRFAAQASLDAMVAASGGLRGVAVALTKVANDMRWLASGPRAGLHELRLPENEPGSSIMPGKVNPTMQEATIMVCLQVMGQDAIVAAAGAQGNFELNAMRPIVIHNVLHSARLLGDAADGLRRHGVEGTELDRERIAADVDASLMLVTALVPHVGYDKASEIARKADSEGTSLREAAIALGISAEDFDRIVDPRGMVGDPRRDLGLT